MIKRLGVIGAGGHGKVAADVALRCGWDEVIFFDSLAAVESYSIGHWQVVGVPESATNYRCDGFFVAIGSALHRRTWCEWLLRNNLPLVSLIDPSAVISSYAGLSEGILVVAGAVVNVDSQLGRGVIINTNACVDHDCVIGAYSHVCPGALLGGGVRVGEGCWLGIGCQIKQFLTLADSVTVGAGATVLTDIDCGLTVVGTPARPI